jgi:altronate dehydratase large subunit
MQAYLRSDGRKGIRNVITVVYLVECAHHVAKQIAAPFEDNDVHVIGFSGCYPNTYALEMMESLCTHPNVGAVLLVSLGCESFNRNQLADTVRLSGRPVDVLVIQQTGGTRKTFEAGREWIRNTLVDLERVERVEMGMHELIVGTVCGGSDGTSGISANPAVGNAFDRLVNLGATTIFEETGELIGCEQDMVRRAITFELGLEILACMEKTANYYNILGHGSFAVGNAEGGLTTLEEKSLGAYAKAGHGALHGIIKPGNVPPNPGLYLLDVIPDGEVRFGFPNINDTAEIGELIACGSHVILFTTGRGSVVGSAISPVIKICGNPETYRRMQDDMDVNAGRILEGQGTIDEVGLEIVERIRRTAEGEKTASESLGHREFVLTYKSFEPIGPSCLPLALA